VLVKIKAQKLEKKFKRQATVRKVLTCRCASAFILLFVHIDCLLKKTTRVFWLKWNSNI